MPFSTARIGMHNYDVFQARINMLYRDKEVIEKHAQVSGSTLTAVLLVD